MTLDSSSGPLTALAFDFGLKHIGVAVGNSVSAGAQPLEIVRADTDAERFARIAELIKQWSPGLLVVGRPTHPDGEPHQMTVRCERFARQLEGRYSLKVDLVDERYSSVDAMDDRRAGRASQSGRKNAKQSGARQTGRVDAEAAAIILRQYWAEQGLI